MSMLACSRYTAPRVAGVAFYSGLTLIKMVHLCASRLTLEAALSCLLGQHPVILAMGVIGISHRQVVPDGRVELVGPAT